MVTNLFLTNIKPVVGIWLLVIQGFQKMVKKMAPSVASKKQQIVGGIPPSFILEPWIQSGHFLETRGKICVGPWDLEYRSII